MIHAGVDRHLKPTTKERAVFKIVDRQEIAFEKDTKPQAIKDAQREVREIYKAICSFKCPQIAIAARETYLDYLGPVKDRVMAASPWTSSCIDSAARSYTQSGPSLLSNPNIFHMNVTLTLDDLRAMRGVPAELVRDLEGTGRTEHTFLAREMTQGVLPVPRKLGKDLGGGFYGKAK